MSDHLDECPEVFIDCYGSSCDCDYSHFCICDALRSCEERVIGAALEAVFALPEYSLRDTCASAIDALRQDSDD